MSAGAVCRKGHKYSKANTYIRPNGDRECRKCAAARCRKFRKSGSPRAVAYRKEKEYRGRKRWTKAARGGK